MDGLPSPRTSEEALKNVGDDGLEVAREGRRGRRREEALVVDLALHPRHEEVDVLGRRDLDGLERRGEVVYGALSHPARSRRRAPW